MIFEFVFDIILELIKVFLSSINFIGFTIPEWSLNFTNLILKGFAFFPFEIWTVVISNVCFWVGVHFIWAVVEWIYLKIPGVN